MNIQRYKVLFDGTLTGEYDLNKTKLRFAKLLGLNTVQIAKLFCGKKFAIKKDITEEDAIKLSENFAKAGGVCSIEKIAGDIIERRQQGPDRRNHFRRSPRPGAIVPDRRLKIRRQVDTEQVEELTLNNFALPIAFQAYPKHHK